MNFVTRIGEALARATSRRTAVRLAAASSFANVATVSAGLVGPRGEQCVARLTYGETACNPPSGIYCNDTTYNNDAANCDGSSCGNGCILDDRYYPQEIQPACWCTSFEQVGDDKNVRGYWRCCDCMCTQPVYNEYGVVYTYDNNMYGCGCREWVEVAFKPVSKKKRKR